MRLALPCLTDNSDHSLVEALPEIPNDISTSPTATHVGLQPGDNSRDNDIKKQTGDTYSFRTAELSRWPVSCVPV